MSRAPADPPADPAAIAAVGDLLGRGRVLVLTGAGISTDSGIPAYRDTAGRLRHASPMTYDRFRSSAVERQRYWARSHLGWPRFAAARPNRGHRAVTALQRAGLLTGVVTHNVDGLHSAAGAVQVVDLHGRLDTVVCLACDERRPRLELGLRLDAVNRGFRDAVLRDGTLRPDGDVALDTAAVRGFRVVDCRRCRGVLKPDVVFFGEHVPAPRFRRSLALLDEAAALLVLGSSLMVGSGFRFIGAAGRRGLPIAIVNRGVTRADRAADVRVDAALAEVLDDLVARWCPSVPERGTEVA
jgi:NAD-dependent SIR2 family protein deacetylase